MTAQRKPPFPDAFVRMYNESLEASGLPRLTEEQADVLRGMLDALGDVALKRQREQQSQEHRDWEEGVEGEGGLE